MATFCKECGQQMVDGEAFCTACGTKAPEKVVTAATPVQQTFQQPVQPVYQQNFAPVEDRSKTVGVGAYFGLMLLFSLPVIGLIACIIMAFAPENKSLKNFARAILIWTIIAVIFIGILFVVVVLFADVMTDYMVDVSDFPIEEFSDVYDDFDMSGDSYVLPDEPVGSF